MDTVVSSSFPLPFKSELSRAKIGFRYFSWILVQSDTFQMSKLKMSLDYTNHTERYSHTEPIPVLRVRIVVMVGWWEGMECMVLIVIKTTRPERHLSGTVLPDC